MSSRVLKGQCAAQAPRMAFAAVSVPRDPEAADITAPGTQDRATLIGKIRSLESGMEAARRDALEAGYRKGEQEARAALVPVISRLNASIAEISGMRAELRRLAEKDTIVLALKIAKRILHRELVVDRNALNALARVVFERLAGSETWQLTVNPQFVDGIRGGLPAGSLDRVRIDADPACAPGTLIVRCGESTMDASIETQLDEIGKGLMDRLS